MKIVFVSWWKIKFLPDTDNLTLHFWLLVSTKKKGKKRKTFQASYKRSTIQH